MKKSKTQNPVRASPEPLQVQVPHDTIEKVLRHFSLCRAAKEPLTRRLMDEDAYWEGRLQGKGALPPSAWLFNAVANKHADAMDAYPTPTVLPREQSDEQAAATLTQVLPVILTNCGFADTYSAGWWEKLKHGTAVYGVFWNPLAHAGAFRGDVDIRTVDLRSLYWDPGARTLEESQNLYLCSRMPAEQIVGAYCPYGEGDPMRQVWTDELLSSSPADNGRGDPAAIGTPEHPGTVVVLDRYYKTSDPNGLQRLHYMKIAGRHVLYDSAADPNWAGRGLYDHGQFPVVLDTLYPVQNAPWGYGMIAVCRAPQDAVDALSYNVMESSMMGTKKRFFASESTAVNEREFLDWNRPIVHVQGDISDARLKEITVEPPDSIYWSVLQGKIQELKETVGNRDVNAGSAGGGVTSAAAISALQEAGDKLSRDSIAASYRAYEKMLRLVIELVRQFYTEERVFRVTGAGGESAYTSLSRATWSGADRTPVFDLVFKAERESVAQRNEQNALALELFKADFFHSDNVEAARIALDMMEFPGKDAIMASLQSSLPQAD